MSEYDDTLNEGMMDPGTPELSAEVVLTLSTFSYPTVEQMERLFTHVRAFGGKPGEVKVQAYSNRYTVHVPIALVKLEEQR